MVQLPGDVSRLGKRAGQLYIWRSDPTAPRRSPILGPVPTTDPNLDTPPSGLVCFFVRLLGVVLTAVVAFLLAVPLSADGDVVAETDAGPPSAASPNIDEGFELPVSPGAVVRGYSPPPEPWLPGHRGVDLSASPSSEVRAAGPGRIAFAGTVAGRPVISIDHDGGFRTTYEPVRSDVMTGDIVERGQVIGHVLGMHPGCKAPACVHWGARWNDDPDGYIDPLSLLGVNLRPIVLKPVEVD